MPTLKTEKELEQYCAKLASAKGCKLYKWVSPNLRGVPDRILVKPGKVIFVEFKNPNGTGKLSAQQLKRHKELMALDQTVVVIDNVEDFKRLLDGWVPAYPFVIGD